jgi:phage terminase large subunit
MEAELENILVIGHRRFGKDELGLNDCAVRASKKPANYLYMLPEGEHVRRSIWTALNPHTGRRRIDESFPEGFRVGPPKEQEMVINVHAMRADKSRVFMSGPQVQHYRSMVQFMGSDNYDAIVGASPYGLYFSEWSLADPQALAMLRPVIAENGGYTRFLTTARGKNHAWKQLKNKGMSNWGVHLLSVGDTKAIPQSKLDEARLEAIDLYGPDVGEALFQQEYYCSFEEIVPGSFYVDLLIRMAKAGRLREITPVLEMPVYAAFDIGYTDAMAIWYFQVHENNEIDFIGYDEFQRTSVPELIPIIKQRSGFIGACLLPHDARQHQVTSGVTVETQLTQAGYTCYVMPQTDDSAQIPSCRQLLPRSNIDPVACARGLTCLRHFHNKPKTEKGGGITWSPRPVHDWSSHAAKAFATAAFFAPSLARGVKGGRYAALNDFWTTDRQPSSMGGGQGWMR